MDRSTLQRTKLQTRIRCGIVVAAVAAAGITVGLPSLARAALADTNTLTFTTRSEGEGRTRGVDFTALGTSTWQGVGTLRVALSNDPNANEMTPKDGDLQLRNVSSETFLSDDGDKAYAVVKG